MDRTSSSYGQACTQCYKAKCRCVPIADQQACERCERLKKACQPYRSPRQRALRRKEDDNNARIAKLEAKVATLVSAVSTEKPSTQVEPSSESSRVTWGDGSKEWERLYGPLMPAPSDNAKATHSVSKPSAGEAEGHLEFFLQHMLPCYPFMIFGKDTTATQLRHHRPFLFQAIMVVTTFPNRQRQARAEHFRNQLFESAFLETQSSMDLLLGLLTYLTWTTDLFLGAADVVSRLMMLATSLVQDLRLFKPVQLDVQLCTAMTSGKAYDMGPAESGNTFLDQLEKKRALLACYVLSTNIACHLGRQDSLRWTPQMERDLSSLALTRPAPSDELYTFHVRVHVIMQEAARMRRTCEEDIDATDGSSFKASPMPRIMFLHSLRGKLQDLVVQNASSANTYVISTSYAHYVELYINQLANAISWGSPLFQVPTRADVRDTSLDFERLDCLWRSVGNIKSWFDNFLAVGPDHLIGLPAHFWSQMVMCLLILKYLSTLDDPSWDHSAVRNAVDIITTIDRCFLVLEQTAKHPRLLTGDNFFSLLANLLTKCREWAVAAMTGSSATSATTSGGSHTAAQYCSPRLPEMSQITGFTRMDLENDQWFEDLISGGSGFVI